MNIFKAIGLTISRLFKQAWALPQTLSEAVKQRQQRAIMHELEAERLDRIRHPEKYRGR